MSEDNDSTLPILDSGGNEEQQKQRDPTGDNRMKRILLATAASALLAGAASAEDVNVGIILGFTGPLESITPGMAAGAELAFAEVNDNGGLPGGAMINAMRAD